MDKIITPTKDGSKTLYIPEIDEHYHSFHGAVTESKHVFVKNGFEFVAGKKNSINILEVGLGTGLNAICTYLKNKEVCSNVNYVALEPFPVEAHWLAELDYPAVIGLNEEDKETFHHMHHIAFSKEEKLGAHFTFQKEKIGLQEFHTTQLFDLVYFDAFAPEKQPEMWETSVFEKLFGLMNPQGVLVTYCVKGNIKRMLKEIGFQIEKLPGPLHGKREMLRVTK